MWHMPDETVSPQQGARLFPSCLSMQAHSAGELKLCVLVLITSLDHNRQA